MKFHNYETSLRSECWGSLKLRTRSMTKCDLMKSTWEKKKEWKGEWRHWKTKETTTRMNECYPSFYLCSLFWTNNNIRAVKDKKCWMDGGRGLFALFTTTITTVTLTFTISHNAPEKVVKIVSHKRRKMSWECRVPWKIIIKCLNSALLLVSSKIYAGMSLVWKLQNSYSRTKK